MAELQDQDLPARPDVEVPDPGVDDEGAPEVLTSRKSSTEAAYRPGEAETVEWVEALYTEAATAKREACHPDTWAADLESYWGGWPGVGELPSYKPRISVPEIQSVGLQELSDLTDSRLTVYVQKERGKTDRDEATEATIQTYWKRRFCDLEFMRATLDAYIFPLGFLQTGWMPMAERGQGEVMYKHRDPITVFPDGDAEDDDSLRYFLFEDVLDLMQIQRDYPENGWKVQPEAEYSVKLGDPKARPSPRATGGSGYLGPLYSQTPMGGVPGYQKARARMLTCVVEDDAIKEEINRVQDRLEMKTVARYPNKRLILVANRRVLYDEDCPYQLAPIMTRVTLQPTVHSYWPQRSIVNTFAELQSTANKADSLVAENMLRLNMALLFADADCGIDPKTWAPVPGLFTLIKPGSKVTEMAGQPMPSDMVQAGERWRGMIRAAMGYTAARTGAGTRGNVAAELTETEISQSMGLTRLRSRLLHQAAQKSVEMLFARFAQFYTTPRHLPYIQDRDLKAVKWEPIPDPSTYAVHVDEDSFQVRSKTMMQRLYLTLAKMNKMPTGRLLKVLEIPDAEKIQQELQAELMLMAAARARQPKGSRSR